MSKNPEFGDIPRQEEWSTLFSPGQEVLNPDILDVVPVYPLLTGEQKALIDQQNAEQRQAQVQQAHIDLETEHVAALAEVVVAGKLGADILSHPDDYPIIWRSSGQIYPLIVTDQTDSRRYDVNRSPWIVFDHAGKNIVMDNSTNAPGDITDEEINDALGQGGPPGPAPEPSDEPITDEEINDLLGQGDDAGDSDDGSTS